MKTTCRVSTSFAVWCDVCGKPAKPIHLPERARGFFCAEHCICNRPAAAGVRRAGPKVAPGPIVPPLRKPDRDNGVRA